MESLQHRLLPFAAQCEVIFVDGGSDDGTPELVRPPFQLISSAKGRGRQLNAGAGAASGDVLLFLHADSSLPEEALDDLRDVMRSHRAGCFGIRFEPSAPLLRVCQAWSNFRAWRGVMFGDQGIFIDRSLFFELGGFPDIPLMEDYRFSLTVRAAGVRGGLARHRITTSSRRFPRSAVGQVRVMCQMARLRSLYRRGADPSDLARMYRDVR